MGDTFSQALRTVLQPVEPARSVVDTERQDQGSVSTIGQPVSGQRRPPFLQGRPAYGVLGEPETVGEGLDPVAASGLKPGQRGRIPIEVAHPHGLAVPEQGSKALGRGPMGAGIANEAGRQQLALEWFEPEDEAAHA